MILELYKRFEGIACNEYNDIIEDTDIIFSYTGRARKLRINLVDNTFIDIWYSQGKEYSYHWEQRDVRNKIYRHDNAPHKKWVKVRSFPKHCHDGTQDNVTESGLSDDPEIAFKQFMAIVRRKIILK